jgi:hypothetical protein
MFLLSIFNLRVYGRETHLFYAEIPNSADAPMLVELLSLVRGILPAHAIWLDGDSPAVCCHLEYAEKNAFLTLMKA